MGRVQNRISQKRVVQNKALCMSRWTINKFSSHNSTMSETGMATTNTRLQGGNTPGHQQQEATVAKEDLEIVAEWVKRDLFEKVKFLYNPQKDLAFEGKIYKKFVRNCKDRLIGLKIGMPSDEYKELYTKMVWTEANKKKLNIVANALTTRRSSVYSAMQNRFVGKFILLLQLLLPHI